MKKKIFAIALYPITLLVGWFATRMSERLYGSLADIEIDDDDD